MHYYALEQLRFSLGYLKLDYNLGQLHCRRYPQCITISNSDCSISKISNRD